MVTMKTCFKCNIEKEYGEFYKHPQTSDGYLNKCKECNKIDVRNNYASRKEQYRAYDKNRQQKSRRRIFNHRYTQLKQRVEGRAGRKYGVMGKPLLSYEDYCVWLNNNIDNFERLYVDWEASGFTRKLTPSIDRIDNTRGYEADNMRWITVTENSRKFNKVIT
jgi:hypothetical protein